VVEERYPGGDGFYLGIYHPRWPLSSTEASQLARAAARFFRVVVEALQDIVVRGLPRPDRQAERAAVRFVTKHLRSQGYAVHDRQRVLCGYDLLAEHVRKELHVEVKGTKTRAHRFFISHNERGVGGRDRHWRLAIVTEATTRPRVRFFTATEMEKGFSFEALEWCCVPRKR
jgi:hypothetical protein